MRHLYLTLMAVCCITIAGMAADVTKKLVQFATPIDKPVSSELVAVGPDNSMYMVGQFNVEFDFAGKTLTPIDMGSTYILKYNADGEPVWGAYIKGTAAPKGLAFADDKLVVVMQTIGKLEFYSASGDASSITATYEANQNSFVLAVSTDGALLWNKMFEAKEDPNTWFFFYNDLSVPMIYIRGVSVGANGAIVLAGSFEGELTLGDNTLRSTTHEWGFPYHTAFYAVLSSADGSVTTSGGIHAMPIGENLPIATAATTDANGNVIVGYSLRGAAQSIDGTIKWEAQSNENGTSNVLLLAKMAPDGSYVWNKFYQLQFNPDANSFVQDKADITHVSILENGKVSVAGSFDGKLSFTDAVEVTSAGKSDFFIAQASADAGLVDFAHRFGNSAANSGLVAFSKANKLYMAGEFARTFDFTESQSLTSNYDTTDVFLASYDFATSTWTANSFGGDSLEFVSGIALTSQGNMVATGIFKATDAAKANMFGTQVTSSLVEGNYVYDSYLLVTGENHAPVATGTIDNATVRAREELSIAIPENLFSDADADNLTITVTLKDGSNLPQWLVFNAETSTISGTPARENMGTIEVTVAATDPYSLSASVTFSITVEAPTGIDDNLLADFRVYPTYASTHINLENVVRAKLFSVAGVMVREVAGQNSISVAGLSAGIYLLHVETTSGDKRVVRTFVK